MSERKMFPIMDGGPSVPWEVLEPHESQALKNHNQTLQRLAERGGLDAGEAWCVVQGIYPSVCTSQEKWNEWRQKWREYAERINLHFDELDALRAEKAAKAAPPGQDWLAPEERQRFQDVDHYKQAGEGERVHLSVNEVWPIFDKAQREIFNLQHWVNDCQSGMYINCVYCGHRYGPKDEVPDSMAEVLKRHIEQCPKHPMSALKKELEDSKNREAILRAVLEDLGRGQLQTPGSFEGYVKARCKFVLGLNAEELLNLDPTRPKLPGEGGAS